MRILIEDRGYTEMSSKDLYLRLLGYLKPYRRQFTLAVLSIALFALTDPMLAYMMKPLINGTFVERDPEFIKYAPVALILLFLMRSIFSFASTVLFSWIAGRLVYDLRAQMFARILVLPTHYFDTTSTGVLLNKLTHNVTQVTTASTKVLTIGVRDFISVVGLLGFMVWLNWLFSVIVFVLMPIIIVTVRLLAIRLRNLHRHRQQAMGDLTHVLEESIRGQKIIKVFGAEAEEQKRFNRTSNWIRRYSFKDKVADAVNIPLVEMMAAFMIATLVYVGTGPRAIDPVSVGDFVAFITALGMLFPPLKRLTRINQPLQQGLAGAESVFDLIDQPAEAGNGTAVLSRPVHGEVVFQQVGFHYGEDGPLVLDDISFTIAPGETVALVGPSGSGKTTIAALLPRLYEPSFGQIRLDGVALADLPLPDLRRQIAYVGQDAILFNDSVAANIAYGKGEVGMDQIRAAADAAHALEFIDALPEGFDTQVGEDGARLSGGQRQRIAIARAILKNAPLLILDEATSALDTESERQVQAALDELTRNKTTLVIAHRLSTIEDADRILVIKGGRIVESGTHESLLSEAGEYALLYREIAAEEHE